MQKCKNAKTKVQTLYNSVKNTFIPYKINSYNSKIKVDCLYRKKFFKMSLTICISIISC